MPFLAQGNDEYTNTRTGILQRELIRQAFLIAARDELGAATRDEVLGEHLNAAAPASPAPEILTMPGLGGLTRLVTST